MPYLQVLSEFREGVRKIAREQKGEDQLLEGVWEPLPSLGSPYPGISPEALWRSGRIILWEGCPVHHRVLNGIPGLDPPGAFAPHTPVTTAPHVPAGQNPRVSAAEWAVGTEDVI